MVSKTPWTPPEGVPQTMPIAEPAAIPHGSIRTTVSQVGNRVLLSMERPDGTKVSQALSLDNAQALVESMMRVMAEIRPR